ncbi:MAG: DUF58 domain-containing protein [Acidimicrobiales bacterium]
MIPVPTRRVAIVAAAAAVVVGAWPGGSAPSLLVVNAVILVSFLIDAATAPTPGQVDVERQIPSVIPLGGEAEVVWTVRNSGARRLTIHLADSLAPSLGASTRKVRLVVPGDPRTTMAATARAALRPTRRGRFDLNRITVRTEGRLGLGARQGEVERRGAIRVYPPFDSRDEAELRINKGRLLEVGLRSAVGRGGGTEFEALREYTADDEFRRVDWSATARAGRPIVRTYRAERNQSVLLLLDTGRTMAGRVGGSPRLEHAMDAVMMLTAVCSRLGDRVGLMAFDRETRAAVPPRSGRAQLGLVTEAMYELEPRLVESDYAAAFVDMLSRYRRRSLVVILTELNEQAVAESLLPALPRVARDHLVVTASVQDPQVAEWASRTPSDIGAGYRRAAAIASLEERRRITARLRGIGVTVVDEQPGKLAPVLADAYLKVKATGRL